MLAAVALALLAQCGPDGPIYSCAALGNKYAFFEFAPSGGAGMGAACACTNPAGAKGEVLTFTRASTAYCTKGNTTASIANGDLVSCGTGLARVMPGGDGTGGLGLLVEEARTNVCLQSEHFENASWIAFTVGAAAASAGAANTDVAPTGATTAQKVTFAATSAAQSSGLSQTILTAAAYSGSVYAQGNATTGSGSFDLCLDNAATATCTTCTFVLATVTRCKLENVTSKASGKFYVGNLSSLNGGTTRSAVTVTLWGSDAETGAFASSHIATTTAAATRVVESATFAVTAPAFGSVAVTMVPPASSANTQSTGFVDARVGGTSGWVLQYTSGFERFAFAPGVNLNATVPFPATTAIRFAATFDGVNTTLYKDGVSQATGAQAGTGPTRAGIIDIGDDHQGLGPNSSVLKSVCVDSDSTRCR